MAKVGRSPQNGCLGLEPKHNLAKDSGLGRLSSVVNCADACQTWSFAKFWDIREMCGFVDSWSPEIKKPVISQVYNHANPLLWSHCRNAALLVLDDQWISGLIWSSGVVMLGKDPDVLIGPTLLLHTFISYGSFATFTRCHRSCCCTFYNVSYGSSSQYWRNTGICFCC